MMIKSVSFLFLMLLSIFCGAMEKAYRELRPRDCFNADVDSFNTIFKHYPLSNNIISDEKIKADFKKAGFVGELYWFDENEISIPLSVAIETQGMGKNKITAMIAPNHNQIYLNHHLDPSFLPKYAKVGAYYAHNYIAEKHWLISNSLYYGGGIGTIITGVYTVLGTALKFSPQRLKVSGIVCCLLPSATYLGYSIKVGTGHILWNAYQKRKAY